MTIHSPTPAGLDNVVAAETVLSHVDGQKGELIVAGRRIGDLAGSTDFEGLAARLWGAASARTVERDAVRSGLGVARAAAFGRLAVLLPVTVGMPMLDAFRVAVAAIAPVPDLPDEVAIVGAMPVLCAALVRQSEGREPVEPDPSAGHAADLVRMMRGHDAGEDECAALDNYLVTVADHGMNASTFAARVVASTRANPFMAVTAGYCALTGALHGGAPEPVLDMLDGIATSDRIAGWIDQALARGERLMGFGHRIYKVRDPRADVLKRAVERLGGRGADLGFAAEVEAYARHALEDAKPDRKLDTNVEFYTAILLDALKIPRRAFTPVFAVGRSAGWTAHAIEQLRTGRLLRPASLYTGEMPQ